MITGKRRYRVGGLFRTKLILQVQYPEDIMVGPTFETRLYWRDAKVEDLMSIEACHRPFPVVSHG